MMIPLGQQKIELTKSELSIISEMILS